MPKTGRGASAKREAGRLRVRRITKHFLHPIEHGLDAAVGSAVLPGSGPETRAEPAIAEQSLQTAFQFGSLLLPDDEGRFEVARHLADTAYRSGDAGQSAQHRLHQRLRNALVGIGRQRENIERLQPGQHIPLVSRQPDPVADAELADSRLDVLPLWSIPDDDQSDIGRQLAESLKQIAVAFPASQRGDDADQSGIDRKPGRAPRAIALSWSETLRVYAGGDRRDALGGKAVVADQLRAQIFARGNDVSRRTTIQPPAGQVVRDRSGDMSRAYERRSPRQGRTSERCEPSIGRAVAVDDVHGVSLQPSPHRQKSPQILPGDRQGPCPETSLERRPVDPRFARRHDRDVVPPRRPPVRLVKNPDFLPAPPARRLRMENFHLP